jgi:hypothetical protein
MDKCSEKSKSNNIVLLTSTRARYTQSLFHPCHSNLLIRNETWKQAIERCFGGFTRCNCKLSDFYHNFKLAVLVKVTSFCIFHSVCTRRLFLAPQGADSTLTISVGGTAGIPQSLAAQLGYAGTNARCVAPAPLSSAPPTSNPSMPYVGVQRSLRMAVPSVLTTF